MSSTIRGILRAMGRRNRYRQPDLQLQQPQLVNSTPTVPEEWGFLANFEHQYGTTHPFFYACSFMQALKIAEDEHKLMFVYLHSPQHPFTPSLCSRTLSSEPVVQFLDANFVSWGAIADRGEGLHMTATLNPASFPFCAVIAPVVGNTIVVLQQMEGPVDPAEMVEILQRTMEEQGSAFGSSARGRSWEEEHMRSRIKEEERIRGRAKEEEKLRADRRLREEQDAAYFAALQRDQEKEKLRNARARKPVEASTQTNYEKLRQMNAEKQQQVGKFRQSSSVREPSVQGKDTQILIRFPSGERREQSFCSTDKILSIYRYIDSLGISGIGNYRLISNFPKIVYSVDQMGMTLKDAGLHPRASLFVELL